MLDLSALKAAAGAALPMGGASVPIVHDRTLYVDGDGLAYNCAGNDETLVSEARQRVREKIAGFMQASAAGKLVILLTGSGSHKGHRYAVARARPYQEARADSRRPKNWKALRDLLEAGEFGEAIIDYDREADDRFGQFGWADYKRTAIATQDKDMQMVPGLHISWNDNQQMWLHPDTFAAQWRDKVYGRKWFWLQMLHGDAVDKIPGVPTAYGKKCGEVTAGKMLAAATTNEEAAWIVAAAYESHYAKDWRTALLEQAVLLWMRQGKDAHWLDCWAAGGPMTCFDGNDPHWQEAVGNINRRVREAQEINDLAATQDN